MIRLAIVSVALIAVGLMWDRGGAGRGELGRLVTRRDAVILRQFYSDLATVVSDTKQIETMGQFSYVQEVAVNVLQINHVFSGSLAALNAPIAKQLAEAVGDGTEVPDAPLDAANRSKLAAALKKIASQF
jgi:hypothetical protein